MNVSSSNKELALTRPNRPSRRALDGRPDPVLEYLELGLEQEGPNGELLIEAVGYSNQLTESWVAFRAGRDPAAIDGGQFMFDLETHRIAPPDPDAITVGLRQLGETTDAFGDPGPALTAEMCAACAVANTTRPVAVVSYKALIALLR